MGQGLSLAMESVPAATAPTRTTQAYATARLGHEVVVGSSRRGMRCSGNQPGHGESRRLPLYLVPRVASAARQAGARGGREGRQVGMVDGGEYIRIWCCAIPLWRGTPLTVGFWRVPFIDHNERISRWRRKSPVHRRRNSMRQAGDDDTAPGAYFITICTHHRQPRFGEIIDQEVMLNPLGQIAHDAWAEACLSAAFLCAARRSPAVMLPITCTRCFGSSTRRSTATRSSAQRCASSGTRWRAPWSTLGGRVQVVSHAASDCSEADRGAAAVAAQFLGIESCAMRKRGWPPCATISVAIHCAGWKIRCIPDAPAARFDGMWG